jgi:hypothetical protein
LPIELFSCENQRRRAAVGAVVAVLGEMAKFDQGGHFLGRKAIARFDGGFAGDHVQQLVDQIATIRGFAVGHKPRDQIV